MQKKVYVAPSLEVIETESESMMLTTIPGGTTNFDENDLGQTDENESTDMSNKRQYGFSSTPWE